VSMKDLIRTIPDYPKKGIKYRDITTLLKSNSGFQESIDRLTDYCEPLKPDLIAGVDARGFIFGSALAYKMNVGFIPIRKQGKLPSTTISEQYELEYGTDCLEIHEDAINQGERIILIDDLLATGGTAKAAESLLTKCGGQVVGAGFLIELSSLKGRALFKDPKLKVFSVFDFQD